MEVNITPWVEQWIAGTYSNYGIGVKLSASFEAFASASADALAETTIKTAVKASK